MGRPSLRRLRWLKQPDTQRISHILQAGALESLRALKESADAFPPLKAATGLVLHIVELSQTVKANRTECQDLAHRATEIMFRIDDIVPDPTQIPPDLLDRILDFVRCMEPIEEFMMNLQRGGFNMMKRVIHRMEHQDKIAGFVRDLDHAFQTFQFISSIKVEVAVRKIEDDVVIHRTRLDSLSTDLKVVVSRLTQLTLVILF